MARRGVFLAKVRHFRPQLVHQDALLAVHTLQPVVATGLEALLADGFAQAEEAGLGLHQLFIHFPNVAEHVARQFVAEVDAPGRHIHAEEGKPGADPLRQGDARLVQILLQHQGPPLAGGPVDLDLPGQGDGIQLQSHGQGVHHIRPRGQILALDDQVECPPVVHQPMAVAVQHQAPGRGDGTHLHGLLHGQLLELTVPYQLEPGVDHHQHRDQAPGQGLEDAETTIQVGALPGVHQRGLGEGPVCIRRQAAQPHRGRLSPAQSQPEPQGWGPAARRTAP